MSDFELWLCDANGARVALIENAKSFTYTHATGGDGTFSIALPGTFPREQLALTRRALFFRKPAGGTNVLDFSGFVRLTSVEANDKDALARTLEGFGPNWLLGGRTVNAGAGEAEANMTAPADDLMKAVVRQQMGALAVAARQYPAARFAVQADASAGPRVPKQFHRRYVVDVLREIAETARNLGTETFYEVKPLGTDRFVFVTSAQQLGRDLRGAGLVFGLEYGNLRRPRLAQDWRTERNVCFALGKGERDTREVQTAEETVRSQATWYGRREMIEDASEQDSAGTLAVAQAAVVNARPVDVFTGELVSTAGSIYGSDWRNGDRVDVQFDGLKFDMLIRTTTVLVDENGKERITTRGEAYL